MRIGRRLRPLLILRDRKEIATLLALRNVHNRRNELDEKPRYLEQRRVEVVEVVQDETLDMGTIVVLWGANVKYFYENQNGRLT